MTRMLAAAVPLVLWAASALGFDCCSCFCNGVQLCQEQPLSGCYGTTFAMCRGTCSNVIYLGFPPTPDRQSGGYCDGSSVCQPFPTYTPTPAPTNTRTPTVTPGTPTPIPTPACAGILVQQAEATPNRCTVSTLPNAAQHNTLGWSVRQLTCGGTNVGPGFTNTTNQVPGFIDSRGYAVSYNATSDYVRVQGFGLSLPPTAPILGVQLSLGHGDTCGFFPIQDAEVRLYAGGTPGTTNKARPGPWLGGGPGCGGSGVSCEAASYGSYADTWGATLTGADVNDAGFGFVLSAQGSGYFACDFSVGQVALGVCYGNTPTPARTPTPTPPPAAGICVPNATPTATNTPTPTATATDTPWPTRSRTPTTPPANTATPTPTPTAACHVDGDCTPPEICVYPPGYCTRAEEALNPLGTRSVMTSSMELRAGGSDAPLVVPIPAALPTPQEGTWSCVDSGSLHQCCLYAAGRWRCATAE